MNVLIVSHEASRTGAPLLMLNLIKWIKKNNPEVNINVLLLREGPLKDEFVKLNPVFVWAISLTSLSLLRRIVSKIFKRNPRVGVQQKILNKLINFNPNIIYVNSIASCEIIPILKNKLKRPIILHVHELETIIRQFNHNNAIEKSFVVVDHFIAVSAIVRDNLMQNHRIEENRISLIYEYVDTKALAARDQTTFKKRDQQKFVIGGVGLAHWRKGVEFFLLVAKAIKDRNNIPDIEFRWIGAVSRDSLIMYEHDITNLGIQKHCSFTGEKNDLSKEYEQMDILLLTSREDPFPVVAIEAACFSTPIICWDKAIGTKELVERGCGFVVGYQDITEMVEAIEKLYFDKELYHQFSANARMLSMEYDIDIAATKIYALMDKLASN